MKHYEQRELGLAQLGHGKWKGHLRCTLLLIGLLLGMGGMKMMAQSDAPDGLQDPSPLMWSL